MRKSTEALSMEVWKYQGSENSSVVFVGKRDVNRGLQTLFFLNSGRFTIDMTTGKLNCVSKQHRQSPVKSGGNFRCDGMTARLLFPPRSRTCARCRRLKRGVNNHVDRRGWRVKEGLGIGCCARDRSCVILLWERTVLRS